VNRSSEDDILSKEGTMFLLRIFLLIEDIKFGGNLLTYLPSLFTLVGIWLILVISPGPNFVATVHHAVSRSRRDGVLVALGVATSEAIWVIVSIIGLGILLARVSWLVELIKIVGALYLSLLGVRMIWKAHCQKQGLVREQASATNSQGSAWWVGFLTNMSNPKTAAFFGSLFALLLPVHPSIGFQIACIVTIVLICAIWYSIVAYVFSFGLVARGYLRMKKWIDTITGGILVTLGIRLASSVHG